MAGDMWWPWCSSAASWLARPSSRKLPRSQPIPQPSGQQRPVSPPTSGGTTGGGAVGAGAAPALAGTVGVELCALAIPLGTDVNLNLAVAR